ncbi:MAG: 2-oxo acid dehydrogenase subunit E2 [Burkholderiales bacterium]|nr:MAG: 2-oxo acid dehydrogenase subunit E2 [Burkholderiales bacterium]
MAAEMLSRSHVQTAPVTLFGEAEVDALVALRERLNDGADRGAGRSADDHAGGARTRVSLTALLVKVTAQALREAPELNATFVDGAVHRHRDVNLGVALSLPDGNLIVPVLHRAERLSLAEVAAQLADLGERGAAGRLTLADVRGATFTLSNPGMLPSARWSTPIIALPQCAILGVGALRRGPVVRDEQVVPAWLLPTSLSFDHRAVNGVPAQRFVDTLHALLNQPSLIEDLR